MFPLVQVGATGEREWFSLLASSFDNIILVRPDGHIAWNSLYQADNFAALEPHSALRHVFRLLNVA